MANVALIIQDLVDTGGSPIAPNYQAVVSGNVYQVPNDGRIVLHFKNTNAAANVVTITTNAVINGHAVANGSVSVPATNGEIVLGKLAPGLYNDANGLLNFSVSQASGGTCAVYHN